MAKRRKGSGDVPPEAQRKDVRFEMRLEPDLMERLERQARRHRMSVGAVLRWAAVYLLESLEPLTPPSPPKE